MIGNSLKEIYLYIYFKEVDVKIFLTRLSVGVRLECLKKCVLKLHFLLFTYKFILGN